MLRDKFTFDYSIPKTLLIELSKNWNVSTGLLLVKEIVSQLSTHPDIEHINLSISKGLKWESGHISFLFNLIREHSHKNIQIVCEGLPQKARRFLPMDLKINKHRIPFHRVIESLFEKIGQMALRNDENVRSGLDFFGDIVLSFGRLIAGKVYFRWDNFLFIIKRCGVDTLLLVSLISLLVGMILAFVGSVQLKMFGAQIYISDIVGIAMVRVFSAVMTGIIVSGRIGAAFAAELGIMQTNEEIDALKTLGVSPVEFLVIPRILALIIMMPILTIYADFMGVLGGFVISTGILNLNPVEYLNHTQQAIKLSYLWIGLIHSFIFGLIVAVTGCFYGIKCERSPAGVGSATTSAVVTGITGILIATLVITFICHILGI